MKVKDIMTQGFEFVQSRDTLQYAAQRMKDRDVGALPVFQENSPVGIITDRDIVINAVANGMDPTQAAVGEILEEGVVFCDDETPLWKAAQIMHEHKVRRLLVQDSEHEFAGILSISDFAQLEDTRLIGGLIQALSF